MCVCGICDWEERRLRSTCMWTCDSERLCASRWGWRPNYLRRQNYGFPQTHGGHTSTQTTQLGSRYRTHTLATVGRPFNGANFIKNYEKRKHGRPNEPDVAMLKRTFIMTHRVPTQQRRNFARTRSLSMRPSRAR